MSSSQTERAYHEKHRGAMGGVDDDVPAALPAEDSGEQQQKEQPAGADRDELELELEQADDGHDDDDDDDDDTRTIREGASADSDGGNASQSRIADILAEERLQGRPATPEPIPSQNGTTTVQHRYRALLRDDTAQQQPQPQQNHDSPASDDGSALGLPRRPGSPAGSAVSSVADSTASNQRSVASSMLSSASGSNRRFGFFRPFDQRFQSRIASPSGSMFAGLTGGGGGGGLTSSASGNSLLSSSSLLALHAAHNRTASSLSSTAADMRPDTAASVAGSDAAASSSSPPWEVVRWTKLTRLSSQAFSESARRSFGAPTCMAIAASIVLGTAKGILLVFDYNQALKLIIGPGTKSVEAGAVTAVAVSADHTTIAGGHANGAIFTWDTSRASRPFLHIPPLDAAQAENPGRSADGHLPGVTITNLGFLGTRRTALVSADDRGMAFSHLATRGTGSLGRTVKTSRILGRYPGAARPQPPPSSPATRPSKPIRPSTVLAFAPLPLGNVDRATDTMGLTAMLTPYLLVIVSTTPVANTQHKSPRPKEVAPHSALSGCLAWFPAVRLKVPDPRTGDAVSKAKLVYCWSNVLTVLDVDEQPADGDADAESQSSKPPSLLCKARSRWKCEEAIVAVQWLTRSVLAVLTISQRLIVLEDHSMRVTEAFDLINRYIYHADLFSRQLHGVVETLDEADPSLHGVVADAFTMSLKAYKGRLFLLGFNDMAIGALSNWADRLIALMEHGDYVGAIRLATSFYTGAADKLTIGLPEDTATRHAMVRRRLLDIMAASLRYAFGQRQKQKEQQQKQLRLRPGAAKSSHDDDDDGDDDDDDQHLRELAQTCFAACTSVDDTAFLFDEMYEWFEEAGLAGVFLETLEPYILDGVVTAVPPAVVKALVRHYVGRGWESRLEEMICHMDTATLDLDQLTALCKTHALYDALAYVWNQALGDFVTPLIELLVLLVPQQLHPASAAAAPAEIDTTDALKLFPYLSYTLTGRVYPTDAPMDEALQRPAKSALYWFLFCGKSVEWPHGSGRRFRTRPDAADAEPSFPYLRLLLQFDAPSFLSVLNEAFEDPFLNDSPERQQAQADLAGPAAATQQQQQGLSEEQVFGLTVDRQYIVSILLEIMHPGDFAPTDTVYLDMFIARNLPKYPQYLLLPESTLTRVLTGLCRYPGSGAAGGAGGEGTTTVDNDLAADAQLSAEYLLSVYRPPDMADLEPLFRAAGFFRILKRSYRADEQFGKLLATYFEDPDDQHGVFACMAACLQASSSSAGENEDSSKRLRRQRQEVYGVLRAHALALAELDAAAAARTLDAHAPDLHGAVLAAAAARPDLQYVYLKTVLEGDHSERAPSAALLPAEDRRDLVEQYIRLLCVFDPSHVADFVEEAAAPPSVAAPGPEADSTTGAVSAPLRLEALLPAMEETGVIDAAVVLMAQEGQAQTAMDRLVRHLHTLEAAVAELLGGEATKTAVVNDGADSDNDDKGSVASAASSRAATVVVQRDAAAEELMQALQKYTHVGIWLCQGQTKAARRRLKPSRAPRKGKTGKPANGDDESDLSPDERLWLDLIDTTVQITRTLSAQVAAAAERTVGPRSNGTAAAGEETDSVGAGDGGRLVSLLRSLVQHTFTALLTTTTTTTATEPSSSPPQPSHAFLRILKAFLARAAAASPSVADLRAVLASVFAAYAYEEAMLRLATRLLDRSLFGNVQQAVTLRQRGWRAKGSTCEGCGRRVWGPGVQAGGQAGGGGGGSSIYEAWETRQAAHKQRRSEARQRQRQALLLSMTGRTEDGPGDEAATAATAAAAAVSATGGRHDSTNDDAVDDVRAGKGKGKETLRPAATQPEAAAAAQPHAGPSPCPGPGPVVLFACRHIYHRACLDALAADSGGARGAAADGGGEARMYVCPVDG